MHVEDEASVNEPQQRKAKKARQYSVIRDALRWAWGQQTLSKSQPKTISAGDRDPNWHSKDVNSPAFSGGARKFERA